MISVCMATYNGANYIKEQIDSIIYQLDENDELIISDDGSTDETIKIIKSYDDKRIKIFHHNRKFANYNNHQKVSANFENAIIHASGDWVFLSDQDDIWAPNKIEVCRKYFQTHDLIVSDCCFIADGKIDYNTTKLANKDPQWSILGIPPNYHGCCMAFKAYYKSLILPFPTKLYVHDAWIGHLVRFRGKCIIIRDKLVYYRLHTMNVSIKRNRNYLYTLNHRLSTVFFLLIRILKHSF